MQLISQDYKKIHNVLSTAFDQYSKQPYYLVPTPLFGKPARWLAPPASSFGDSKLGLMLYESQRQAFKDVCVLIELIPSLGSDFSYSGLDIVVIVEAYDYKLKTVTVSVGCYNASNKIDVTEDSHPEIFFQAMNFYNKAIELKAAGVKFSDALEQLMVVNKPQ